MPDRPAPSTKPLLEKIGVKPGFSVLVLGAPVDVMPLLTLPPGATLQTVRSGQCDAVLLFARSKAEVDGNARTAVEATKPGGLLWVAYPKKGKGPATDISRDVGWDTLSSLDWEGVSLVAVNDAWSAIRFRPLADTPAGRRRSDPR